MPLPGHFRVNFADYEASQDAWSAEIQLAISTVDGPSHGLEHVTESRDSSRQCEALGESCAENAGCDCMMGLVIINQCAKVLI